MDKQKDNLKIRLEVAIRISKNAALQRQAIKNNDIKLLGKLIKRQQGNIDKLMRVTKSEKLMYQDENNMESKQQEEAINSYLNEAIQQNTENIACAEALKASIGKSLYSIKVSGNAIRNGYFGGVQPRRGCYFDRKK